MRQWLIAGRLLRGLLIVIVTVCVGVGLQSFIPWCFMQMPFGWGVVASQSQAMAAEIEEASPPVVVQALRWHLTPYQPQVEIRSPKAQQVIQDDTVSVKFRVKDLSIFKDEGLDLGPHLQVLLDDQPYGKVYDLSQPFILQNLTPGTHTLRAFAASPWNESFKNDGAYSQVTFHSFVKTQDYSPDLAMPLLTYNQPQGEIGAEPVMLDFYLTNVEETPSEPSQASPWQVRVTINGNGFLVHQWQPLYLSGFKPGKNWVRLELLDEQGQPISNIFNDTVHLFTLSPEGQDTLAQLARDELSVVDARGIVDPDYVPKSVMDAAPNSVPEAFVFEEGKSEDVDMLPMATHRVEEGATSQSEDAAEDKLSS